MNPPTNPLLPRALQPYLESLQNYQPAPARSIANYYIEDSTIKSKPDALATTKSKTFGDSFNDGLGDAVSAPFDATFDFLFSLTAGGPNSIGASVLIAPPAVAVAVICLPISVPCGIIKGLVKGYQTLVGTQIPKG